MKPVDSFVIKIKDNFFSCEKGQIWKNNDTQEYFSILNIYSDLGDFNISLYNLDKFKSCNITIKTFVENYSFTTHNNFVYKTYKNIMLLISYLERNISQVDRNISKVDKIIKNVDDIVSRAEIYEAYSYYVGTEVSCGRMPLKFGPWRRNR